MRRDFVHAGRREGGSLEDALGRVAERAGGASGRRRRRKTTRADLAAGPRVSETSRADLAAGPTSLNYLRFEARFFVAFFVARFFVAFLAVLANSLPPS